MSEHNAPVVVPLPQVYTLIRGGGDILILGQDGEQIDQQTYDLILNELMARNTPPAAIEEQAS